MSGSAPLSASPTIWLTLPEAAVVARVHKNTIRRAVQQGRLRAYRLNNRRVWRFRHVDLDAWLSAAPTVAVQP